ncbi:MAG: 50S ribosomal protein L29 [Candidatus Paceibacterota bacterium]|jgi:ribosomal protein L29
MKKDIKTKDAKDLQKLLVEKQDALRAFRLGLSGGKVKNVKEGAEIKKDIARIMTEVSSRRISTIAK